MGYEFVRVVPENERPTEPPVIPQPQCAMVNPGTEEEWAAYHLAAAVYYDGIEVRKVQ